MIGFCSSTESEVCKDLEDPAKVLKLSFGLLKDLLDDKHIVQSSVLWFFQTER